MIGIFMVVHDVEATKTLNHTLHVILDVSCPTTSVGIYASH